MPQEMGVPTAAYETFLPPSELEERASFSENTEATIVIKSRWTSRPGKGF